ncbi:MAG: tRNA (adenosine(37)-N6)-threonylcarbamoyltransferase complex ATPase subunit type 1 TsaE [Syntrophomonadaceae bacterium]
MQIIVPSEQDMEVLGQSLARVLENGDIVYLLGELGAGKTTLVRGVARGLGYKGNVNSPTFTIMNIYNSIPAICHFDFYRLNESDISDLGLEDYLEKEGIALIEWPQAGKRFLPEEALVIKIELVNDDYDRERKVSITSRGDTYANKLEELKKVVDFGD